MIVRIIKSNDDGKVLEDRTYHQYTERQWTQKFYKLRKNAKGHEEKWKRIRHAIFYTEDEVLPMTEREKARYKEKVRQQRKQDRLDREERKRFEIEQEERELRKEREEEIKTAWQWLARERRVPLDGVEARPVDYEDVGRWYYYQRKDTRPATDEEYERLKALYIEKFGGWNQIDLKTTEYDGHKWW